MTPEAELVPDGFKMTELGPLPEEWQVVRLGEVAQITSGGSAPQGSCYFGGSNPFVRVQHLDLDSDLVHRWDLITDEAVEKFKLRLFPKGTIVFPKSGAAIRLEKRAILPVDAYLVSHLAAILPNETVTDSLYVFYALRAVRFAENKAEGYPTLGLNEIREKVIPLPPLLEQRAIAQVLRTVQRAKEATERVIAATRELKKSLMRHLFTYGPVPLDATDRVPLKETEIGLIPEHWQVVRLGEVCSLSTTSVNPTKTPNSRYIGLEHIESGNIKIKTWGHPNEVRSLKSVFQSGDILYGKLRPYLDKAALAEWSGICSTDILVLRRKEGVDGEFLAYLMHTQNFVSYAISTTTGVNHPRTSWQALQKMPIPLPPLPEQREIARILQAVDRKIAAEEKRKAALEALFKTMLHLLMTGQVRVKNIGIRDPSGGVVDGEKRLNEGGEI